ncbi:MAG: thioredoxin family protein [Flavobacteriaceae bacterium]
MKKLLFVLALAIAFSLQAQHSISGTFSPTKDFTWVIAYRLQPGTQGYIADTAVNNGQFNLQIPANAEPGTYRLVYGVPQEDFYFDVLFNGQEDIQLDFDRDKGVSFRESQENKIYHSYFQEINAAKQQFIDFYSAGKTDKKAYSVLAKKLEETQIAYENSTKGMLVENFIKANRPYIPSAFETQEVYWQNKKDDFFKHLDVKNPVLQASGFITDRLSNFVFTPITTEKLSKEASEKSYAQNLKTVHENVKTTEPLFQLHIFQKLWNQSVAYGFNDTADFIYKTYLKDLAVSTNNQQLINEIEVSNRLRVGAKAPELTWNDAKGAHSLSAMEQADCYVVIFWSSTCSHCLKELPALHQQMKDFPKTKVLAIGLEESEIPWKTESAKLSGFEHAIALGKWESPFVKLYDVHKTPTYYILDKDKRILANPDSDKEVVAFLNQ